MIRGVENREEILGNVHTDSHSEGASAAGNSTFGSVEQEEV